MKSKKGWKEGCRSFMDERDRCSWDSPDEWLVIGLCGLCGCGRNDVKEDIVNIFCKIAERQDIEQTKYNELIMHVLDNANLIEHGTSIYYSWLTIKGEKVYTLIMKEVEE